jgi:hypothetical protein
MQQNREKCFAETLPPPFPIIPCSSFWFQTHGPYPNADTHQAPAWVHCYDPLTQSWSLLRGYVIWETGHLTPRSHMARHGGDCLPFPHHHVACILLFPLLLAAIGSSEQCCLCFCLLPQPLPLFGSSLGHSLIPASSEKRTHE